MPQAHFDLTGIAKIPNEIVVPNQNGVSIAKILISPTDNQAKTNETTPANQNSVAAKHQQVVHQLHLLSIVFNIY